MVVKRKLLKIPESKKSHVSVEPCEGDSVLISVVLSSRTKDERSSAAMDRLRDYGLTVEHIRETSVDELAQLILPVSFYPTKANYIKKIVEILHDEYDNDIPREFDDIISLPGVGPKMAFMLTNIA